MRAQRGLALIGVLWIMATAVTLLTWTLSRHWMAIQRSAALLESRQAHYYALAGESYARQLLAADRLRGQIDHRGEAWAQPLTAMEIEDGALWVHIDDLQGRFNMNQLIDTTGRVDPGALRRLGRLFSALGLPERLVDEVADWLNPERSSNRAGSGTVVPHRQFAEVAQLRELAGMTEDRFQRLAPHVAALPGRQPININTASAEVLQSLAPGLTAARARSLVAEAGQRAWTSTAAFASAAGLAGALPPERVSVASRHFQVRVEARHGRQRAQLTSTLHRRWNAAARRPELTLMGRRWQVEYHGEERP